MTLGLFNIGGGEIVLILVLLLVLLAVALGVIGVVYLIIRAFTNKSPASSVQLPNEAQRSRDAEHLKLAWILHWVFAGLAMLGIAFLGVHYVIMRTVFNNPNMWKGQQNTPPKEFFDAFVYFYLFMGAVFIACATLNVISGLFIRRRQNRMFSVVIAALNCLQIPFGTALGVFTIMLLSRESVRQLYGEAPVPGK